MVRTPLLLSLVALLLSSCAPLGTVQEKTPRLPAPLPDGQEPLELQQARLDAETALSLIDDHEQPQLAIAKSSQAARISLEQLSHGPCSNAQEAKAIYNFSVARLVEALSQDPSPHWKNLDSVSNPIQEISSSHEIWDPAHDLLRAVDRMDIGGLYFKQQVVRKGLGAPFVSSGPSCTEPFSPTYHYTSTTAVATFNGNETTVRLECPYYQSQITLNGKNYPLAADLSAPIAENVKENDPRWVGLWALLYPSEYEKDTRMVMREPYHPGLQPVILIHGLMDSPVSWVPEINAFNSNPELRKHYQIWYFQYSSAPPFPISAEILREDLQKIYTKYPNTPKAILIGHSMGGLIAHMLMCDSGTEYSRDIVGKTVEELHLSPKAEVLAGSLQFHVSPYVAKVIFEATPHRGATMAANAIGRLGAMLVRIPESMVRMGVNVFTQRSSDSLARRFPNGIVTLQPMSQAIRAMNKLPLDPHIPFYSIIGNWDSYPDIANSSDGVVPYSSAHLPGAVRERIVPSLHDTLIYSPEALDEIQRILLENINESSKGQGH